MPFKRLGLDVGLLEGVAEMGYKTPTPIQEKAIPEALAGKDVIGCAQTGTGKTAAFVLPTLQRISDKQGIKSLVVTPTRELAGQIVEVAEGCAKFTHHKVALVHGGVAYGPQIDKIKAGVDMLVATPGRLLDLMNRGVIELRNVEVFVLDEADRMLDMGFWPDVQKIVRRLPAKRQSLLFSATMSPEVLRVIGHTLNSPVSIEVGQVAKPVDNIEQLIYPVDGMQKTDLLIELLKQKHLERVLVFTKTKRRADYLFRILNKEGIAAAPIHSDLSQAVRQKTLAGFKSGTHRVLVATDIVARGIDIEAVSHVINYDIPENPEDYIHRIGRTARANAEGMALTFMSAEELADFRDIETFIGKCLQTADLEGFDYMPRFVPEPNPKFSGKPAPPGASRRSRGRPRGPRRPVRR